MVFLSPLLAAIAAAVYLTDRGPVFYRQNRVGLSGQGFTIIKFRTMNEGAERDLGPIWAVQHDPRCTPIGSVLRRFGLDELPQLWNILKGEMSLIGPRPERPQFTRRFKKEHRGYEVRESVRPGLTGFAQVHGWRGCTSLEERLRHDLHYVKHWSLALDVKVLALTLAWGWSERTRQGVN
jgi:lipopolysaccharide/colanic/teichoic acid biosynthesis glycosyltransferase